MFFRRARRAGYAEGGAAMDRFLAAAKGGVASIPAESWATTLRNFSVDHEGKLVSYFRT